LIGIDNNRGQAFIGAMTAVGQGSAGNVIAALASLFIPGLGQLVQGRFLAAVFFFVASVVLWFLLLGWVIHLWSCLNAALWKPR
jgi:TM2 domain-containing membrane protein YozV